MQLLKVALGYQLNMVFALMEGWRDGYSLKQLDIRPYAINYISISIILTFTLVFPRKEEISVLQQNFPSDWFPLRVFSSKYEFKNFRENPTQKIFSFRRKNVSYEIALQIFVNARFIITSWKMVNEIKLNELYCRCWLMSITSQMQNC